MQFVSFGWGRQMGVSALSYFSRWLSFGGLTDENNLLLTDENDVPLTGEL